MGLTVDMYGVAPKAMEIFVDAVMELNLDHLNRILHGSADAATQFLLDRTYRPLEEVFSPIIDHVLEKFSVTDLFSDLIDAWNRIPFVSDIDFDLVEYTTDKALDGLFFLIGTREAKIRESHELANSAKLIAVLDNIDDLFFSDSDDDSDYADDSGEGYDESGSSSGSGSSSRDSSSSSS